LNNASLPLCIISVHVGIGKFTLSHTIGLFILTTFSMMIIHSPFFQLTTLNSYINYFMANALLAVKNNRDDRRYWEGIVLLYPATVLIKNNLSKAVCFQNIIQLFKNLNQPLWSAKMVYSGFSHKCQTIDWLGVYTVNKIVYIIKVK
jgi:hypothetical protein